MTLPALTNRNEERLMKPGYIICIIAIAAVLVYFILSYVFPGAPTWIVFIAAGLGMVIAMAVKKKE